MRRILKITAVGLTLLVLILLGVAWHVISAERMLLQTLRSGHGPDPKNVQVRRHGRPWASSSDPEVLAYVGNLLRTASDKRDIDSLDGQGLDGTLTLHYSLGRRTSPPIMFFRNADAMMIVAGEQLSGDRTGHLLYVVFLDDDAPDELRDMLGFRGEQD
ncbi:MAG: hypothetical protein WD294_04055 [Phycisphaeraceae bacterium]